MSKKENQSFKKIFICMLLMFLVISLISYSKNKFKIIEVKATEIQTSNLTTNSNNFVTTKSTSTTVTNISSTKPKTTYSTTKEVSITVPTTIFTTIPTTTLITKTPVVTTTTKCSHSNSTTVIKKKATCVNSGQSAVVCTNCNFVFETKTIPITNHQFSNWITTVVASPNKKGTQKRTCSICKKEEIKSIPFVPVNNNSIYIPSINLNSKYVIAEFKQSSVDNNDIVCVYKKCGNNPLIVGHAAKSLGKIKNIKVGDYIYFTHDGITDTYKVTHSEFGLEVDDNTNIKGIKTGKICLYNANVPTIHMFTCAYHPQYGNHRWMVIAEKI
jgi:hypothetical protein